MHIIVWAGTKGEIIKLIPILQEMDKQGVKYLLVLTGQHTTITKRILKTFDILQPYFFITERKRDIANVFECIIWWCKCLIKCLLNRKKIFLQNSLLVVHGDTESSLLGSVVSKLMKIKLVHVEAGLRSNNFWEPFPEEIIRRIIDNISDYVFCPGKKACANIKNKEKSIDTHYNTVLEAVLFVTNLHPSISIPKDKYVVASFHRKENLYIKARILKIIECIGQISKSYRVLLLLDQNAFFTLQKFNLLKYLENYSNVEIQKPMHYPDFIHLILNSEFVVTDGGSLQEETYFLNKPCLLLRRTTEREDGLGETAYLSKLQNERIKYFLKNYKKFRRIQSIENLSPAKIIVDVLKNLPY